MQKELRSDESKNESSLKLGSSSLTNPDGSLSRQKGQGHYAAAGFYMNQVMSWSWSHQGQSLLGLRLGFKAGSVADKQACGS